MEEGEERVEQGSCYNKRGEARDQVNSDKKAGKKRVARKEHLRRGGTINQPRVGKAHGVTLNESADRWLYFAARFLIESINNCNTRLNPSGIVSCTALTWILIENSRCSVLLFCCVLVLLKDADIAADEPKELNDDLEEMPKLLSCCVDCLVILEILALNSMLTSSI
jgi:hypothetical protein